MRPYEVMMILGAGLEEDAIQAVLDRSTETVRAGGGTPGKLERWGRRRLAYEIDHRAEGYYALLEATAEPAAMNELDRMLRLADEVVRHKVIRLPEGVSARDRGPAASTPQVQPETAVASTEDSKGSEQ